MFNAKEAVELWLEEAIDCGQAARAVPDLEQYLAHASDATDLDAVARRVALLRREAN